MKSILQILSSTLLLAIALTSAVAQAQYAIPAPPQRGSAEDQADFTQILALQQSRTDADCKRAQAEVDESFAVFFGRTYGSLTELEVARLSDAFDRFSLAIEPIAKAEKNKWGRLRPYDEDARVHPCVPRAGKFSYPSSHATVSEVFANILTRIYPARDPSVFLTRARQIGEDRVLGGVHHPSDIVAGRQLGDEIFAQWIADPAFLEELAQLRSASLPRMQDLFRFLR